MEHNENEYESIYYNPLRYFMATPFILFAKLFAWCGSVISGAPVILLDPSMMRIRYLNEDDFDE